MKEQRHLSSQEKEFIIEHLGSMSNKEISRKLGIPRHTVQKYRDSAELKNSGKRALSIIPLDKLPFKKLKTAAGWAVFVAILLLAFGLRKHTFDLPHYRGDQHHYVGLAFKLDTSGISGYNLRGIDMYSLREHPEVVQMAPARDKGRIIKSLAEGGITYYDEPLHHMPFGFPLAIMLSHKIFAAGQPYYMLAVNDTAIIRKAPPGVGLRNFRFDPAIAGKQFYSIIIPLASSMLLIVLVYLTARTLYNDEWIPPVAMFLMAISPIDILTSQKIWADDMTAALMVAAVLLYLVAVKKQAPFFAFAGGIACGMGVVTKQNAAIGAFAIVIWHFLSNADRLFRKETFLKVVFDKNLMLFGTGCILSAGYWFIKITLTYGDPIYRPHQENLIEAAETAWFRLVQGRPKHLYLLGIPYQNPLFILAYLSPLWLWLDKKQFKNTLFPVIWLAAAFCVAYKLMGGEHRYMLPAYPAFAILGAYVANRLRIFLNSKAGPWTGTILLVAALAVSAFWSVPMALETVFHNGALIMKPF